MSVGFMGKRHIEFAKKNQKQDIAHAQLPQSMRGIFTKKFIYTDYTV